MKKEIVVLILVLMLVSCAPKPEISGKRITGAVVTDTESLSQADVEAEEVDGVKSSLSFSQKSEEVPQETAADALAKAKVEEQKKSVPKQAATWYPPVVSDKKGTDALKERTRAAFSKSSFNDSIDADKSSGSKYYSDDGDPKNLPDDYGDDRAYE